MPHLDTDEIKSLVELMREHGLAEIECERDGERIRLRLAEPRPGAPPIAPEVAVDPGDSPEVVTVEAPILGTFYRAGGPDQEPFAQVGDIVGKGDVLCVIEAMKLMNEIKSDCDGEIREIFAENGQPVQYGDRLFAIGPRPSA